jgi:hypothetical protein
MNIEGVVAHFAVTSRVLRGRTYTGVEGLTLQAFRVRPTAPCGGVGRKVRVGGEV